MSYKIISKIASGTFGTVYKVQNSTNGEFFALKLIHENYKTPNELKRIKRGFETAQKVSHPNCVKMVEWYEKGNDVGFVMEFVETIDVLTQSEAIKNSKSESLTNSQNLTDKISKIIQIANGLEALHSRGIVHRDLKPANILETVSGQIKITDFDLVKLDDSSTLTASGAFLGTAKYSSPEQCQNAAKIDFRSDLYSLGVLFYQLVCGRVPFDGDSLAEIALAHIRTPLISPKQFIPDLPEEINTVISKLLKKNPKDRFQSAQEVSKILSTFLKEGKVENLETFGDFLLTPGFVGRRREFSELNKIFSETTNKLNTVLISGEQGVGKTKLWKEFRLGLPQNSTLVFETKCRQNGNTFEPLQTILTKALEQIENLSSKEQAEKIGRFGRDLSKILPQLENKLFYKHLPEIPTLEGSDSELRLFEALTTFLQNIQKENQTLVFFFDDLQWVDEQSLKFLGYLSRSLSESSVLVAGTVRNEETEKIKSEIEGSEILNLENFNLEEVREFLTKMFGKSDPVNTRFCEEILKRTGGNVLFVQELMYHLLETKKLSKSEGNWDLGEESFSELKLPKSIQSVVGERLNFLPKDLLKLLELGSLLGKYFSAKVVSGVHLVEENEIETKLANQSFEGILEKSETGVFEFVNDSFRESLSSLIKTTTKKSLHKKIAVFLEKNFEESEVLEELANHYFEANSKKKALEFCLKAKKKANLNSAVSKEKLFIDNLLQLIGNKDYKLKSQILDDQILNLNALGLQPETLKISEQMVKNAQNSGSKILVVRALIQKSNCLRHNQKFDECFDVLNEILNLTESLKDKKILVEAFFAFGEFYSVVGDYENKKFYFEKALKEAKTINYEEAIAASYSHLGSYYSFTGQFEKAISFYEFGLEYSQKNEMILETIVSKRNIAGDLIHLRKFDLGLEKNLEILDEVKDLGLTSELPMTYYSLAVLKLMQGKLEEASEYSLEEEKILKKIGRITSLVYNYNNQFDINLNLGNIEKAEEYLEKQTSLSEKFNEVSGKMISLKNYCLIEFCKKNYLKSIEFADSVILTLERVNQPNRLPLIIKMKAKSFVELESFQKARELMEKYSEVNSKFANEQEKQSFELIKIEIDYALSAHKTKILNSLLEKITAENSPKIKTELQFLFCKLYIKNPVRNSEIFIGNVKDFQKNAIQDLKELNDEFPNFENRTKINLLESWTFKETEIYPELISTLTNWMNPETAFEELLKFLQKETNSNGCQIILKNKSNFEVVAVSPNLKDEEIEFSKSVLQKAIESKTPTLLKNVLEIPELKENQSVVGKIFLSVIAVPLEVEQKIIGALYLDRVKIEKGFFTNSDLKNVTTIAKILSPVLARQNEAVKMKIDSEIHKLGIFIGNSPRMQKVYEQIENAANYNFPVYIHGETGTGKELVAESLHRLSNRRAKPFVTLNCATIPENLAESELFGHAKGAFSGAVSTKIGKFEFSDGGTLFLDEIGELPLNLQAKLLRAIQKKEIVRVGGNDAIKIDLRIIVATHKDLKKEVEDKNFREDLFHRLNVLKISVPPLRERIEDIPQLANHFLHKISEENNRQANGFTSQALIFLQQQNWSGNVRELENLVAKSIVNKRNDLPINSKELGLTEAKQLKKIISVSEEPTEPDQEFEGNSYDEKISKIERKILLSELEKNNWNKSQTAISLNLTRVKLYRLLSKHGL